MVTNPTGVLGILGGVPQGKPEKNAQFFQQKTNLAKLK